MKLGLSDTQHILSIQYYYAEYTDYLNVMLSVIMLSVAASHALSEGKMM